MLGLKLNHVSESGLSFPELHKLCLPAGMDKRSNALKSEIK